MGQSESLITIKPKDKSIIDCYIWLGFGKNDIFLKIELQKSRGTPRLYVAMQAN